MPNAEISQSFWRKTLYAVISVISVFCSTTAGSLQLKLNQKNAGSSHLAFDVVSIKRSKSLLDAPQKNFQHDEYIAFNKSIGSLILMAYFPAQLRFQDRIKKAPSWIWDRSYDVEAKVAPEDVSEWQRQLDRSVTDNLVLRAMFQTMLKDRCGLTLHRVPSTTRGYSLETTKRMRLNIASPDSTVHLNSVLMEGGATVTLSETAELRQWTFYNAKLSTLAAFLSTLSEVPVQDKTGLAQRYDFVVTEKLVDAEPPTYAVAPNGALRFQSATPFNFMDLGLRLTVANVPIDALVVDHIQKPDGN